MSLEYEVFKRTWWREARADEYGWPNNLVPHAGRKTHTCYVDTEDDARRLCHSHNADHNPGRLGMKYEYQRTGGGYG